MDKNGIFVTESHYLIPLIKDLQYDTIYHEHLRYYSLTSLKYFFSLMNLRIIDAKKIPTHGGSIRVTATKNKKLRQSKNVYKILNEEKKFLNIQRLNKFKNEVVLSKLKLNMLLFSLKKNKKRIFGISAPSRAATIINYVGIDENIVKTYLKLKVLRKLENIFLVQRFIFEENILYKEKPHYVLIFSWHIYKQIISSLKKNGYKGKFIIPLPEPRILK